MIDLRERLEQTCRASKRRAKWRKFKVFDKVLLLLPTDSNKLLLQWKGPFEVVKVLNRMDYRIDVNGVIGTYQLNFKA